MQKILKRVATAERVAARRRTVKERQVSLKERKDVQDQVKFQHGELVRDFNRAKQAIRDDWNLGPLAPSFRTKHYRPGDIEGAISEGRYKSYFPIREHQLEARCAWAGGLEHLNLKVGDRVVVLEGPDKGRIGKLSEIQKESAEVVVSGLNKSNIKMPIELRSGDAPPAMNIELPLPISAIRLVHPIRDPKTDETKDVIINQLKAEGIFKDRATGEKTWWRVVPSLNMTIPWPPEEPRDAVEHKVDTLRIDVEERTFVPTLLRPPMPDQVIDELRNRYSRFRTRHEPEYLAKLGATEQAKKDRQKLMESMRTPLQEFHRAERQRKKKKGKPRLTPEMLEEIGMVIAKNRRIPIDGTSMANTTTTNAPEVPLITVSPAPTPMAPPPSV